MIKTVKINLTASDPNLPLARSCVFAGSAASFTIINVPRAVGSRAITAVSAIVKNVAGVTVTKTAVRVGSAYEVTLPASHFATVGTVTNGVKIVASGTDENNTSATWVLGVGPLAVLDPAGSVTPGTTTHGVNHEEFADVTTLSNASLNEVSAKVNQILTILKPAALALLLSFLTIHKPACLVLAMTIASLSARAALQPSTLFGDVPPTNTIEEVVEAAGGAGGGVSSNKVEQILAPATNATLAAAKADASEKYLPLTGGTIGGDSDASLAVGYDVYATGHDSLAQGFRSSALGDYSVSIGSYATARGIGSIALGCDVESGDGITGHGGAFVWNAGATMDYYYSHGNYTFNINPAGGPAGFYIGETNFVGHVTNIVNTMVDHAITTGLTQTVIATIGTNTVSVVVNDEINNLLGSNWRSTYGSGLAGLIAAILAALALLKKTKLGAGLNADGTPSDSNVSTLFSRVDTSSVTVDNLLNNAELEKSMKVCAQHYGGGGTATGIEITDSATGAVWQLTCANGIFTWVIKES